MPDTPGTTSSGSRNQLYAPLRTDVPQIRLLELELSKSTLNIELISLGGRSPLQSALSDLFSGEVCCRLRTVNLNDAPPYLALSYVWGDASKTRNISVNGREVAVTVNLERALRRIRAKWRSILRLRSLQNSDFKAKAESQPEIIGPFWVDALCINQLDKEEKTHQVQLMCNIYEKAGLVTAWVCKDGEEVQTALQVIQDVVKAVDKAKNQSLSDWEDLVPELWAADSGQYVLNRSWNCVIDLSALPYFSRIWVLQEMVLGREVVFMIGDMLVGAPTLIMFLQIMKGIYPARPALSQLHAPGNLRETAPTARLRRERIGGFIHFYSLGFVAALRSGLTKQKPLKLLSVLCLTPRLEATDPRDKLYGLLGVTSGGVAVDYSKSTTKIYTEYASSILANHTQPFKNSSILQLSGLDLWATGNEEGPSWVPCWSAFSRDEYHCKVLFVSRSDQFLTSHNVPASNLTIPSDDTLCLTVTVCDSIVYVAPQKFASMSSEGDLERWLANLLFEASEGCSELPEQDFYRIVRCLMADYNAEKGTRLQDGELISITAAVARQLRACAKEERCEIPLWMRGEDAVIVQEANKLTQDAQEEAMALFKYSAANYRSSERFARTAKGLFVLAPTTTDIEDLVCVIQDCGTPMLIRQQDDYHRIVGSCFVVGLMDGEATDMLEQENAFVWDMQIK